MDKYIIVLIGIVLMIIIYLIFTFYKNEEKSTFNKRINSVLNINKEIIEVDTMGDDTMRYDTMGDKINIDTAKDGYTPPKVIIPIESKKYGAFSRILDGAVVDAETNTMSKDVKSISHVY